MIGRVVPTLAAVVTLALTACGTSTSASAAPTATVSGSVTASPTCPVERPNHPCPPAPASANVQATNSHGRVVASTQTDAKGRYQLQLRGGTYTLAAVTPHVFPRCSPMSVTVRASDSYRVDISCDTGIR